MSQQANVEIVINDEPISPFSSLSIIQQFNGHHQFELRFNHDVLEQKHAVTIDKSSDYLGKPITVTLSTLEGGEPDHIFKGIVTNIAISNNPSTPGDLIFKGYSPTILLEAGAHNHSYLDKGLTAIVNDTLQGVPGNELTIKVSPVKTTPIPFVVQYGESHFAFLRRLAAEYGEWFFYDGTTFNFGKPSSSSDLALQYPHHISEMNLQMRIAPLSFEQSGYLSKDNKKLNNDSSSQQVEGLDPFGEQAVKASDQTFTIKTNQLTPRKFLQASELEDTLKVAKSSVASGLVELSAGSDYPYIRLGANVSITSVNAENVKVDVGKFVVTSVMHFADGHGNYHNNFKAIPSTVKIMPNPYSEKPMAETQLAIVKENKDPDNLGKVKVQLLWQKDPDTTPFIRVLTPHGGSYGNDKKTRGVFFTPEVDDYVIVAFTQNDPERPFVMGSLPHGKAIDSAPNSDNHIKSISTRSGTIISFFDKESDKEQEIRIQTDETNYISINLVNSDGTIKIYSSKAIEVNSGESIKVESAKTINFKSEKITIEATDSILMQANQKIEIKAADVLIEASKGFEAKGGATVKISGAQTEIEGSATAKVKGAMLDLEGSGVTNVKGGIVKIN